MKKETLLLFSLLLLAGCSNKEANKTNALTKDDFSDARLTLHFCKEEEDNHYLAITPIVLNESLTKEIINFDKSQRENGKAKLDSIGQAGDWVVNQIGFYRIEMISPFVSYPRFLHLSSRDDIKISYSKDKGILAESKESSSVVSYDTTNGNFLKIISNLNDLVKEATYTKTKNDKFESEL